MERELCCDEFRERINRRPRRDEHGFVYLRNDREWVLIEDNEIRLGNIRFCPFCGAELKPPAE